MAAASRAEGARRKGPGGINKEVKDEKRERRIVKIRTGRIVCVVAEVRPKIDGSLFIGLKLL